MAAAEIISKLSSAFDKAKLSGDLLFFPSTVHKHVELGIEFELRLCPALEKKPEIPNADFDVPSGRVPDHIDPFSPPYSNNLFVGEITDESEGEEYAVLLNKYAVVPQHFILVTKAYFSQASPLLPSDLVQTYTLLLAAQKAGKRYFSFYNCGDKSGASQPHKHIQFLPLPENIEGPPIELLAKATRLETSDRPFSLTSLPYANHVYRFPPISSSMPESELSDTLSRAFLSLLDLVISTVRHAPDYPAGLPSYNVLMTLDHMHMIPRRHEAYVLPETGERVLVNSLGFAGMLLLKREEQLQVVKREGVGKILRGVSVESVHDLQVDETSREAD